MPSPINAASQAVQFSANNVSFLSSIQQKVCLAVAAVFILLLTVAAATIGIMARSRTQAIANPIIQEEKISRNQLSHMLRMMEEMIRDEKGDASFKEEGLLRVPVSQSDKKTKIAQLQYVDGVTGEWASLDMSLAIMKDLIKQMNLFGGELQATVFAFGANPPEDKNLLIQGLQHLVQQLDIRGQEDLRLFISVLHRVSLHADSNEMTPKNIALSINDVLSPVESFATQGEYFSTAGYVKTFTELLITHYNEVFPQVLSLN